MHPSPTPDHAPHSPQMQLAEWILDEGLYGVSVEVARDTFLAIKALMVSVCLRAV